MITLGILTRRAATVGFSDDFTGPNGQLLSARSGWSVGVAPPSGKDFQVSATAAAPNTVLASLGNGGGTFSYTRGGSQISTAGYSKADMYAAFDNTGQYKNRGGGLGILLSGTTTATLNGYFVTVDKEYDPDDGWSVGVALYQINNGVLAGLTSNGISTTQNSNTVVVSSVILSVSFTSVGVTSIRVGVGVNNTQVINFDDASQNRKTSGSRGLVSVADISSTANDNQPLLDNYSDDGPSE